MGTKTKGRTEAFAGNFMPLLGEKTEFGAKWARVYDYQIEEGIHDPILAYEFMNRYYVQEGNKRVSVLKYVNAYSVPALCNPPASPPPVRKQTTVCIMPFWISIRYPLTVTYGSAERKATAAF